MSFEPTKNAPERRCGWTRERAPKERLLRWVLSPDGEPGVDLRGRAPGRGVYLSPDRHVVQAALTPKGLGRLFRGAARMPDGGADALIDRVAAALEAQIRERVTLARRANGLVLGADAVLEDSSELAFVLAAEDVSDRTWGRIQKGFDRAEGPVLFRFGTRAQWGQVLGTKDVGVVGVRPSVMAERLAADAERYRRLTHSPGQGPEAGAEEQGT